MQGGGGPQYQPGSQNSMVGAGAMNPYMLDTFGHGQYYQPYGLAQQAQVPQQPYYHVPTEYIPEGTPGLGETPQQAQERKLKEAGNFYMVTGANWDVDKSYTQLTASR
jgi:hypothetical protein